MTELFPFIESSLRNYNDAAIIRAACLCLSECSRSIKDKMEIYLPNITKLMGLLLKEESADREIKVLAFECIADVSLNASSKFLQYVPETMATIVAAIDLSL